VASPGTGSCSQSLTIPTSSVSEDMDKRSYSPSLLSPSIPPNPPSSPIDEQGSTHHSRRPQAQGGTSALSKLNVNAVPFVPAKLTSASEAESQKSDASSARKLEFDQKEEPPRKVSGGDVGIPWDQMSCHIPPRPRPCGSIQTSGQVTSESNTTSTGDHRDSGQSQCRSQDEPASEGSLLRLGASVSPSMNYSSAGDNLVISTSSPLEQPDGSFQGTSDGIPSLVASPPPISESHGDVWPEIPSSPPPPIPLPPSHYQKVHMASDSTTTQSPTLISPVPASGTNQTSNFSSPVGDSHHPSVPSSSSQQPSCSAPSPTQYVGAVNYGASSVSAGSQSPPIVSPFDASSLTSSTAPPVIAPLSSSPSAISSSATVSSATPTLALATLPVAPKSGAWGSNRVKSWASVFKETPGSGTTPTNCQPAVAPGKPTTVAMVTSTEGSTGQERSTNEMSAAKMAEIGVAVRWGGTGGPDSNLQLKKLGGRSLVLGDSK